jgi:long-chain fatty acid transport protein
MSRASRILALPLALVSPMLFAGSAHAAGFYIQDSSVSALGSAFAGSVSSTNDASTVWFNPANMTSLDKRQVNLGVNLLLPEADLSDNGSTFLGAPVGGGDGGNPYDPTAVPNLFFATPVTSDKALWAGIGVTAPFGLASDYGDTWFGRYDSTQTELTVLNISPVLAYKVNDMFSLGGGVDVQYAKADLRGTATVPGPATGQSALKGTDWSVGYNFGITAEPLKGTKVGAHYRSGIDQKLDGDIMFSSALGSTVTGGTAELNLPDIFTLGVTQEIKPDWRVMGQLSWYGWNQFDRIRAVTDGGVVAQDQYQDYQNTLAFSIGAEHDINDIWTVRAGYQYDPTPTTDSGRTSRTPDGDRNWFTGGATYNYSETMSFDFAAAYIDVGNGTIDATRNGGAAEVLADTDGRVGIVSAALNYKF